MATTTYKVLRRVQAGGRLEEVATVEASGSAQALRKAAADLPPQPAPATPSDAVAALTLVAVPVSNWTEVTVQIETQTTIRLQDVGSGDTVVEEDDAA